MKGASPRLMGQKTKGVCFGARSSRKAKNLTTGPCRNSSTGNRNGLGDIILHSPFSKPKKKMRCTLGRYARMGTGSIQSNQTEDHRSAGTNPTGRHGGTAPPIGVPFLVIPSMPGLRITSGPKKTEANPRGGGCSATSRVRGGLPKVDESALGYTENS